MHKCLCLFKDTGCFKIYTKYHNTKGQIISKGLFGVLEFSQKTNERIRRSSRVVGEFEDAKSPFEII